MQIKNKKKQKASQNQDFIQQLPQLSRKKESTQSYKQLEEFQYNEFQNILNTSKTNNFHMIQNQLKTTTQGFQTFQSIIQDIEDNHKTPKKNKFLSQSKCLFECLKYNSDQKSQIDNLNKDMMKTSYQSLQKWTQQKQKKIQFLCKKIKKTKIPMEQEQQVQLIQQEEQIQENVIQQQQNQKIYSFVFDPLPGPPTLQGASMTIIQNQIYIYGGKNSLVNKNIYTLNLENLTWNRQNNKQKTIDGRLGHQANYWNQNLLIFGGELRYNPTIKIRECNSDLYQYNIYDQEWSFIKTSNTPGPRRNFSSCIIANKFLMIYGGISPYGQYLYDTQFLNLDTMLWDNQTIENDPLQYQGLAFHTMCFIAKGEYKISSVNLPFPEVRKDQIINRIKSDGVFVFGGKNQQGESTNILKQIKLGNNVLKWNLVGTIGQKPSQRYYHSMNYYQSTNLLIIHGGFSEIVQTALNDIYCLNMQNFNWHQVILKGIPLLPRYGHCAEIIESCMIIFGGYNLEQHRSAQLSIIEFDEHRIKLRETNQLPSNSPLIKNKINSIARKTIIVQNTVENEVKQKIDEQENEQNIISFKPKPSKQFLKQQSDQFYSENQ